MYDYNDDGKWKVMRVWKEIISTEFSTDMMRHIDKLADKVYNFVILYDIVVEKDVHIV